MTVADRIAVMDRGRLMQVAPPAEIYEQPNSRWVADFVGDINLFEGRLGDDGMSVEGTLWRRSAASARSPPPSPVRRSGSRCGRRRSSISRVANRLRLKKAADMHVAQQWSMSAISATCRSTSCAAMPACRSRPRSPIPARSGRPDAIGWDDKVWLSCSAASRDRADAMKKTAADNSIWQQACRARSLCVAARVLPCAVSDRAQDQPVADGDRAAALYADASISPPAGTG